jgi:hypothetical protein
MESHIPHVQVQQINLGQTVELVSFSIPNLGLRTDGWSILTL